MVVGSAAIATRPRRLNLRRCRGRRAGVSEGERAEGGRERAHLVGLDAEAALVVDAVVAAARLRDEARHDAVEGDAVIVTCGRKREVSARREGGGRERRRTFEAELDEAVGGRGSAGEHSSSGKEWLWTHLRTAFGHSRFHSSMRMSPIEVCRTTTPSVRGSVTLQVCESAS